MGPSGAGKTTLLSLLSQRIDPSFYIEGRVISHKYEDFGKWIPIQLKELL